MSTRPAAPGDHPWRPAGRGQSRPFLPDLLAGVVFVSLGLAFATAGSRYDVGTALRMGSGYVPVALGTLLALLGLVIVATAFRGGDPLVVAAERGPIPWRRAALLVGAVMFFGLTVDGLGLAPSLLVTTFIAALAGQGTRPVKAAIIAVGLTALCLVVFVALLRLRLPLLGDWAGG
jgi:hypothetical protein